MDFISEQSQRLRESFEQEVKIEAAKVRYLQEEAKRLSRYADLKAKAIDALAQLEADPDMPLAVKALVAKEARAALDERLPISQRRCALTAIRKKARL